MGSLNMVFGAHRETLEQKPDLARTILGIHRKATEFAMGDRDAMVEMAVAKLGQKKDAIAASAPNVELTWLFGETEIGQAKTYAARMLELKQIKRVPDFASFFDTRFVEDLKNQT